jgi:hypothetical protein
MQFAGGDDFEESAEVENPLKEEGAALPEGDQAK